MARLQDFQTVTPTSADKLLVVQSQGQGLVPYSTKLDSANPTGTGSLSLNRKANTTTGTSSVAVGYNNEASNNYSFAEGVNAVSSGVASHAEGQGATSSGNMAHAEGYGTIANHRSQHVFGEFNTADNSSAASGSKGNYVEIVGKGSSDANRSNARTLDWNGNEVLAGGLSINGGQPVQAMVELESIGANVTKTYTIPTSIYDSYGVYILAFGSNYGAGAVYLLNIRSISGSEGMIFTPLKTTQYITIEAVAANQFKVTTGGANFRPRLTRIA